MKANEPGFVQDEGRSNKEELQRVQAQALNLKASLRVMIITWSEDPDESPLLALTFGLSYT